MWLEKIKLKSLIGFHSASKIDSYNGGGGGEKKEKKIQKNLENKSKNKNNKCFSWVIDVSILSHTGSHSLLYLPRMPSNTVLISAPAVEFSSFFSFLFLKFFKPIFIFSIFIP